MSYISYITASDSISSITGKQLSQLMGRISQQTAASYNKARDDIFQFAENPVIQLSFLQFSYGQRMETLKERLNIYRSNSDTLDRVSLYTDKGEMVLTSPMDYGDNNKSILKPSDIIDAYKENFSIKQYVSGENKQIIFFKRVYDYEDITVPVGILVFEMPLTVFTGFIDQVDIADGMLKEISDLQGNVIYKKEDMETNRNYKDYREHTTRVDELGWEIRLRIPEEAIIKDIINLRNTSFVFVMLITSVGFIAAMLFVERILTPVRQIIKGTNRFSRGDMDYRINMNYGKELRMLADSFDSMAESLQKRQNELVQANKLASLGLMSAGIAHEIKNPLAAIKTSVQVLKRRIRTEANITLANGIQEEVERLNKIISDLLNFSKPGPANIVEYDLQKILKYCLQLMNKDIKDRNVKLINKTFKADVMVDPAQMQQIVINLVLNALSAVEEGNGIIELDMQKDGDNIIFDIKDNGKGIPPDKLDKIFDPFFTLTSGGTGLGLSVVFTLLRQNNVQHSVYSKEGEGTRFRLIFNNVERGIDG
jgi:signal transduction histidine kinase